VKTGEVSDDSDAGFLLISDALVGIGTVRDFLVGASKAKG